MFSLNPYDASLTRNKLLSLQIETISKKLEAKTLVESSSKRLGSDFF